MTVHGSYMTNTKINFRAVLSICIVVVLTMLLHQEPGGETWGYWSFADELYNEGKFIIQSRSPLYVLYLQLFYWAGFPFFVYMEWIITSLITGFSLYLLLRIQLSEWVSILAVVVWLPFIRYSEPPVQSLALAMTCIAFVIRSNSLNLDSDRSAITASYTFLIMAYMFRTTYILLLILVVLYDIWNCYKLKGFKNIFINIMPTLRDWHLLTVLTFFVVSSLLVSQHPWNNAWFATTTWLPVSGEHTSLVYSGFIQLINLHYIEFMYGHSTSHDIYFTNKELFGDATTFLSAFFSNYEFVIWHWWRNILNLIELTSNFNLFTNSIALIPWVGGLIGTILLLYGAIKSAVSNNQIFLLLIATILMIGSTVIGMPKMRYMVPAVPFLILSAYWYSSAITNVVLPKVFATKTSFVISILFLFANLTLIVIILLYSERMILSGSFITLNPKFEGVYDWLVMVITIAYFLLFIALASQFFSFSSDKFRGKAKKYITNMIIPVLFLSFTQATSLWQEIIRDAITDPKIMTDDNFSFTNSKDKILSLGGNCSGIMTGEHNIMRVIFSNYDTTIYDITEIPPFGNLDDSVYDGLNLNRVDCLFISNSLSQGLGGRVTNQRWRYKHYIQPYELELLSLGASLYKLDGYGTAVILQKDK
jgi:hypothetical protein